VDEADTARGQQTVAREDKKQSDTSKTKDKQPVRRGYCFLCKVQYCNAKMQCDTVLHHSLDAQLPRPVGKNNVVGSSHTDTEA
jgi:hypothetical protein